MSPVIVAVFLFVALLGAQTKAPPLKPIPSQGTTAAQDKEMEAVIRAKLVKSKIGKDGFTVRVQGGIARSIASPKDGNAPEASASDPTARTLH